MTGILKHSILNTLGLLVGILIRRHHMAEESVLKRATIYSVLLLLLVFFFSFYNHNYKESMSYANDKDSVKSENVTKDSVNNGKCLDKINQNLSGIWINTLGKEDPNLTKIIGNKCIIIEKPLKSDNTTKLVLEDLAVDSSIVLTVSNPMEFTLSQEQIGWIYDSKACIDPVKSFDITYGSVDQSGAHSNQIILILDTTYAYQIYEDIDNFYIALLQPEEVYDKIIVIDAGHGGIDSGTYSDGYEYLEKDMNLSMLLYLKEYLDQADFKIYYTRTTDRKLSLSQRVDLANAVNADLFLSIHCNASEDEGTSGIEVLYNEKQNNVSSFTSKDFAEICLEEVNRLILRNNRGIVPRSHNVQIIGDSKVPVALIEVGFMTNSSDLNFLLKETNQKLVAKGIFQAIIRALEEIG